MLQTAPYGITTQELTSKLIIKLSAKYLAVTPLWYKYRCTTAKHYTDEQNIYIGTHNTVYIFHGLSIIHFVQLNKIEIC